MSMIHPSFQPSSAFFQLTQLTQLDDSMPPWLRACHQALDVGSFATPSSELLPTHYKGQSSASCVHLPQHLDGLNPPLSVTRPVRPGLASDPQMPNRHQSDLRSPARLGRRSVELKSQNRETKLKILISNS